MPFQIEIKKLVNKVLVPASGRSANSVYTACKNDPQKHQVNLKIAKQKSAHLNMSQAGDAIKHHPLPINQAKAISILKGMVQDYDIAQQKAAEQELDVRDVLKKNRIKKTTEQKGEQKRKELKGISVRLKEEKKKNEEEMQKKIQKNIKRSRDVPSPPARDLPIG